MRCQWQPRYIASATMLFFSSWGPADDGRIKPDIVANGASLYSTDNDNNSDYITLSGTGMSSPNAAGSAALLIDYYDNLFPAEAMLSSTLKALIIHTADDLGNPGPDYSYGWGLMNTRAAADIIKDHHDDPASKLVNDLDLRIVAPDATTYYPHILDQINPSYSATTGDNILDNVEQIYLPLTAQPWIYTIRISHKGILTDSQQSYSLIITGQSTPTPDFEDDGDVGLDDLITFAQNWLETNCGYCNGADFDNDENVNMEDWPIFAQSWMQ